MFKKILIGGGVLVALLVVIVAAQPSEYYVERSLEMGAPAEVVWEQLSDFNAWKAWSPWHKMDPDQKTNVTGDAGAVGHTSYWDGEKSGKGSQAIVVADKPKHLGMKLVMLEPMPDEAKTGFKLEEVGDATKVTWFIDGNNNFVKKFFALVMGMEEMLGSMFDQGLSELKPIVEQKAKEQAAARAAAAGDSASE